MRAVSKSKLTESVITPAHLGWGVFHAAHGTGEITGFNLTKDTDEKSLCVVVEFHAYKDLEASYNHVRFFTITGRAHHTDAHPTLMFGHAGGSSSPGFQCGQLVAIFRGDVPELAIYSVEINEMVDKEIEKHGREGGDHFVVPINTTKAEIVRVSYLAPASVHTEFQYPESSTWKEKANQFYVNSLDLPF